MDVELSIQCGLVQDLKAPGVKKSKKQKRRDMTIALTLTSDSVFIDFRRILWVSLLCSWIISRALTSFSRLGRPLSRM